jgi:hypothetical protein
MSKKLSPLPQKVWTVERLNIQGEELPVIRHAESWHLAPLALRYVLRTRFYLGLNSLLRDVYSVAHAYNWGEQVEGVGDLEEFLVSGRTLNRGQLLQLSEWLRRSDRGSESHIVSNQVYNARLFAARQYLEWAIEPTNHGGKALLDEDEIELEIAKMQRLFKGLELRTGRAHRLEPLIPCEIKLIRRAIAPDEFGEFPAGVFTETTRYRNWVMFEKVLNFGDRKGEMLATKIEHLEPCMVDGCVFIPRQQDDEDDTRAFQPRGKTLERLVQPTNRTVLSTLMHYRDNPPPEGRNSPKFTSPYLFVTEDGEPLSVRAADYVIKQIGKYAALLAETEPDLDPHMRKYIRSSLLGLSWHRVRHTWAEETAVALYEKYGEGAWPILKEWGGWSDEKSMEHYIRHARRAISDRAARDYQSSFSLEG